MFDNSVNLLNKATKYKHYLTGIPALNHHYYDWHKCSMDYSRQFPDEVKSWCGWGIENNIANPIRAYLDYLFYNIKFERRVPNMRIDMFLFNDNEEKEIEEKIETMLKPALIDDEELELLELFKGYLYGGKYDFRSKTYAKRKSKREKIKSSNSAPQKSLEEYLKEADIKNIDLIDLLLEYENTMPQSELLEKFSKIAKDKT